MEVVLSLHFGMPIYICFPRGVVFFFFFFFFFLSLLAYGLYHGDVHEGNVTLQEIN